jgi:hypothetical protein
MLKNNSNTNKVMTQLMTKDNIKKAVDMFIQDTSNFKINIHISKMQKYEHISGCYYNMPIINMIIECDLFEIGWKELRTNFPYFSNIFFIDRNILNKYGKFDYAHRYFTNKLGNEVKSYNVSAKRIKDSIEEEFTNNDMFRIARNSIVDEISLKIKEMINSDDIKNHIKEMTLICMKEDIKNIFQAHKCINGLEIVDMVLTEREISFIVGE